MLHPTHQPGLPRHGARLQTTFGEATVTSVDILRREVRMRGADGTEFLQHADDLLPGGIPRRPEG